MYVDKETHLTSTGTINISKQDERTIKGMTDEGLYEYNDWFILHTVFQTSKPSSDYHHVFFNSHSLSPSLSPAPLSPEDT